LQNAHSFIDAIFFPIPAFFLQVSLSVVDPSSALWLATAGFIACMLGTPFGYLIGRMLGSAILDRVLKKRWLDAGEDLFQKNGETAILIGAFTPIPFKVFTILSGSLKYPLWKLLAYASIGRAAKFYVVGFLFYWYGRSAEGMLKDVSLYIAIGGVTFGLLYLLIRRYWRKRRMAANPANMDNEQATDQVQTTDLPHIEHRAETDEYEEADENAVMDVAEIEVNAGNDNGNAAAKDDEETEKHAETDEPVEEHAAQEKKDETS